MPQPSDLTPDQLAKMKAGLPIVLALLNNDLRKLDALLKASGAEDPSWPLDGMFYVAVALATALAGFTGQSVRTALETMERAEVSVFPGSPPKWDVGIELVEAMRTGDPRATEIGSQMDLPTALHTAISMDSALIFELDSTGFVTAEQWIQQFAKWLSDGAPAAPPGWTPPVPL